MSWSRSLPMASTFKSLKKSTDNESTQVVSHCLATSVVLRKILQHFPNTELLTLSLVSKQWSYEARCVIRDRGSSIANLVDSHLLPPRRDLAAFASDLLQMNVVPFCGMKISLDWIPPSPYLVQPFQMQPIEASISDIIFDRLQFKCLHIVIQAPFGGLGDPTLVFVQKVLQGLGGDLEQLAISVQPEHDNFFTRLFRQYTFPNLKTFSFDARDDEDYTQFIKMLVSHAPNLQELHVDLSYFQTNVLEGSSSALLVPCKDFDPLRQQIPQSLVRMLRLKGLSVAEGTTDFSVERFNRIVPMWLETSRTSLKSLKIHAVFVVPIMGYGICLENVTELILYMDPYWDLDFFCASDSLKILDLLKDCDFTRIFPKLHDVNIESRSNGLKLDHLNQFLRQGKSAIMLQKSMGDRAAKIKHLSLSECLNSYTARLLPNVFPDIQRLSVRLDEQVDIACELIWRFWPDLKEIKVQKTAWLRDVPWMDNLDSVFCGIWPEEVKELRGKDEEYLKRVNIVPVMPAITCLKNLKKFRFVFDWSDWSGTRTGSSRSGGGLRDPNFAFSKVSGLVAFARCPDLSVSLETNWAAMERALSHMKPYTSVVLTQSC